MDTLCGELPAEEVAAITRAVHPARTTELTLRVHADPTASHRRTVHRYWKRELADPSVQWLIPWCSGNDPYPERHERSELASAGFGDANWCPGCTGLAR
ncbi:hypothetical protein [Amycolatopsis dendrobii]|uniref:Uncharacterized protein n=1 Tax=Amycolatopsis dendrobii TaxID=2760662 RepID=A0A7W3VVQ4_9PSEU|nr:hypothetical protein [Amycolatopsis dendrobii]MBB1154015.1 hypothetical protein [Amycolatopsis dendrobii]